MLFPIFIFHEMTGYKKCQYRLVFEELFLLQLGLLSVKTVLSDGKEGIAFAPNRKEMVDFINSIGFTLTNARRGCGRDRKGYGKQPCNEQACAGDVGSGKTIVAALALAKAVKSGYQGQ